MQGRGCSWWTAAAQFSLGQTLSLEQRRAGGMPTGSLALVQFLGQCVTRLDYTWKASVSRQSAQQGCRRLCAGALDGRVAEQQRSLCNCTRSRVTGTGNGATMCHSHSEQQAAWSLEDGAQPSCMWQYLPSCMDRAGVTRYRTQCAQCGTRMPPRRVADARLEVLL